MYHTHGDLWPILVVYPSLEILSLNDSDMKRTAVCLAEASPLLGELLSNLAAHMQYEARRTYAIHTHDMIPFVLYIHACIHWF